MTELANISDESNEDTPEGEKGEPNQEELEISPFDTPDLKMQGILRNFEVHAMQRSKNSLDISSFNSGQKDKLLEILSKNEDNAFAYHTEKLKAQKDVAIAQINATTVNQKTFRYLGILVLIVIVIISLSILFYKSDFFVPWLTFLTGLLGGFGLGKASKSFNTTPKVPKIDDDDDDDDK